MKQTEKEYQEYQEYLEVVDIGGVSSRYDCIPDEYMSGNILELGSSVGINQLVSRHKERFLKAVSENRYIGVDVVIPLKPLLPVVKCEIMDYVPERKFDCILLMDVIEHIQFRDWFILFPRLKQWLNPKGILIMTMPYKSGIERYLYHEGYYSCHVVFNISRKVISRFLPEARFERIRFWQKCLVWRVKGESHLWALGRFIKRVLTRHPLGRIVKRQRRLNVFWVNELCNIQSLRKEVIE